MTRKSHRSAFADESERCTACAIVASMKRREVKIANRPSACGWQASKGASLLWK
jgi:ribosomal protein L37E